MAPTLRSRMDRLLSDFGIDKMGSMALDVKAVASELNVEFTGIAATVAALEKEAYGADGSGSDAAASPPASTAPATSDGLEARSVGELKAEAKARGTSLVGCVEKADMIAAIRAAAAAGPAAAAPAADVAADAAPAPAPGASGAVQRRLTRQMIARVLQGTSHYEVLGIETTATKRDVKAAYRDLACLLHPDKCAETDAAEAFKKVNEAQETLSDDARRAVYDAARPGSMPTPAAPPPPPPPAETPAEPRRRPRRKRDHDFCSSETAEAKRARHVPLQPSSSRCICGSPSTGQQRTCIAANHHCICGKPPNGWSCAARIHTPVSNGWTQSWTYHG